MSCQQIALSEVKLIEVQKKYKKQIRALSYFFSDAIPPSSFLRDKIKFGGGTALAMYYFQHRLSFDVDLFLTEQQFMAYINPNLWLEESNNFNNSEYINLHNHIGLVAKNNIKVDVLVDSSSSGGLVDKSRQIFPFDIAIESIDDILSKKIVFRKKDNKARDIFDIAVAISKDSNIINRLMENERISLGDVLVLRSALLSLNKDKYCREIDIVAPSEKYQGLSLSAPDIIMNNIEASLSTVLVSQEVNELSDSEREQAVKELVDEGDRELGLK